jgi:phosphopantothenoylcysteine synthetase/decarboxylase
MKKILITGGPVHAHLDAVKIITNRFRGGRMAELADVIGAMSDQKAKITYLTSKGSCVPKGVETTVVYHNGFEDYRKRALELAPKMDAVILGAAVCNLIPVKPWKGKFPSHKFKVGSVIPIDFTIAPRVIDEVRKVAPKTKLFGFKLLQGVKHEELIDAAYEIVLDSGAVCVFANDANSLDTKFAVTKERGVISLSANQRTVYEHNDFYEFLWAAINDKYYSTVLCPANDVNLQDYHQATVAMNELVKKYAPKFKKKYGKKKYVFGTVAVRVGRTPSFVTTIRGKKDLQDRTLVHKVDNSRRKVYVEGEKATLNAPLFYNIFKNKEFKHVQAIVHYHELTDDPKVVGGPYAPPGTVRDSVIDLHPGHKRFQTQGHGMFELLTKEELP